MASELRESFVIESCPVDVLHGTDRKHVEGVEYHEECPLQTTSKSKHHAYAMLNNSISLMMLKSKGA